MAAPVYVQTLTTTIKGPKRSYWLAPNTLIVGPNGSGKTAIVQSLEVALAGRASKRGSGLISREVDLLALAGPDGFRVEVGLSNGLDVTAEIRGTVAKATRMVRSGPEAVISADYDAVFPGSRVAAALDGSPETLRKILVPIVARGVSRSDVVDLIGIAWPDVAAYVSESNPDTMLPIDVLIAAREGAQAWQRQIAQRVLAAETLERSVQSAASAEAGAHRDPVVLRQEAAVAADLIQRLRVKAEDLGPARQAAIDAVPMPASAGPIPEWTIKLAQSYIDRGRKACGVCGAESSPADFQSQIDRIQAWQAKHAEDTRAAQARIAEISAHYAEKAQKIADKIREVEGRAHRIALDLEAVAAADRISTQAARDAAADLVKLRAEAERVRGHVDKLGAGVKQALVLGTRTLEAQLSKVYGAPVGVHLTEGDREVCRIGLVREGAVDTEVSGSEWARLLSAIAAVTLDGASEAAHPRVIVVPDRQYTPETLAAILPAIAHASAQVVVQSVVMPAGGAPEGWSVIDLGAGA